MADSSSIRTARHDYGAEARSAATNEAYSEGLRRFERAQRREKLMKMADAALVAMLLGLVIWMVIDGIYSGVPR